MVDELPGMKLKPIGIIRSEIKQPSLRDTADLVSEIIIDSGLTEALDNLDEFSHIIVIYWMHQSSQQPNIKLRLYPKGNKDLPLTGLFATRSPHRPNPLGKTTVRLLQRRGNILEVKGLDAIDGTPVIDIKPYIPGYDSATGAKMPSWIIIKASQALQSVYDRLMAAYGPQHWWPAQEPFEMITGAILTQSAAWANVEKAIANLKAAEALSPAALRRLSHNEIATLVRPSGYYNAKALKLKYFADWLGEKYNDNLVKLFESDIVHLRHQLLSIHGIGPETADSIILYAANKPIFIIDAYTRRIISRIGLAPGNESYTTYQTLFMDNLPIDASLFNEFHALLVCLAKNICRPRPLCHLCCLKEICYRYQNKPKNSAGKTVESKD